MLNPLLCSILSLQGIATAAKASCQRLSTQVARHTVVAAVPVLTCHFQTAQAQTVIKLAMPSLELEAQTFRTLSICLIKLDFAVSCLSCEKCTFGGNNVFSSFIIMSLLGVSAVSK